MLLNFHFIYPLWLLALVPTIWLFFLLRRQQEATSQWKRLIAPNLLPYLVDKASSDQRSRPYRLLVIASVLAVLALAGPTWQREPSPFSEDEAPLVIALDLSPSMTVSDIQPSRLERSKQKIRDLLAQRRTGRTALIAYSGSAHLVMPLTNDTRIIETYLADLTPAVMPRVGDAPAQVLPIADTVLAKASVPGSILFVTDGIDPDQLPAFVDYHRQSQTDLVVLGVGTLAGGAIPQADATATETYSRLNRQGLEALTRQAGAYVTEVTADAIDIRRLTQHIQQHLAQIQASDSDRWRNAGYWLLYPLAGLMLFWFRRGWTIQWLTAFVMGCLLWPTAAIATPIQPGYLVQVHPTTIAPSPSLAGIPRRFLNLWFTPDQQGRWLLDHGKFAAAAERFDDPFWKGVAHYVDSDFEAAAAQFNQVSPKTSTVYFDLANAYAQQEDYQAALKYYDRALGMRPDYADAQANRDLVQANFDRQQALAKQRPEEQSGDLKADKVVEDDSPPPESKDDNEHARPNQDGMGTIDLTDLWLQNVQTTPVDFLKQKFQYQLEASSVPEVRP